MGSTRLTPPHARGVGPLGLPLYNHEAIHNHIIGTQPAALLQTEAFSFTGSAQDHNVCTVQRQVRYNHASSLDTNALVAGDNFSVMKRLHAQHGACLDLIYIDPPFLSNAQYDHKGLAQGTRFSDQWADGHKTYVPWLSERLVLMHRLLKPTGSIYVHLDWHCVHYIKVEMDKIFGHDAFQREIIWRMGWVSGYKTKACNWIRNHDNILFYTKSPKDFVFNKEYIPYEEDYVRRDGKKPTGKGIAIEDTWNCSEADRMDTIQIKSFDREKTGYNTQKNEALLGRIIRASSPEGGIVADFFCGSGTTCVVAQKLGRRWIGVDYNPQAVQVAADRVSRIAEQKDKSVGESIPDFEAAMQRGFIIHAASGYARQDIAQLDDDRSGHGLSEFQHFVLDAYLNDAGHKGNQQVHASCHDHGQEVAVLVAANCGVTRWDEVVAMLSAIPQSAAAHRVEIIGWSFDNKLVRAHRSLASKSGALVQLKRMVLGDAESCCSPATTNMQFMTVAPAALSA